MRWVSNSNSKALTKTHDKIKTFYFFHMIVSVNLGKCHFNGRTPTCNWWNTTLHGCRCRIWEPGTTSCCLSHTFSKVLILKVKANVLHVLNWHVFYMITNNYFISSQIAWGNGVLTSGLRFKMHSKKFIP